MHSVAWSPRRSRLRIVVVAILLALVPLPVEQRAEAAAGDLRLPNLRATPATNIAFGNGYDLRFSTFSWNAGAGPLELRAGATDSATNSQDVWQRIYVEGGNPVDRLAGKFVWHPSHGHFHFEGYALYEIQRADAPGASLRTGQKTTFCVMDTNARDLTLPGAPTTAGYTTCGSTVQGMSIGWGDRYGSSLSGQSIDMTGMPDGDYRLSIEIDPNNRVQEVTRDDNRSCVLIRVAVAARNVVVLNPNSCDPLVPVTLSSLTPNRLAIGASVAATIKGSGFVPGLSATFANGNGTMPTISGLTVLDASTATATISVRRKAKLGTNPVWDLRFGDGTLASALTVTP